MKEKRILVSAPACAEHLGSEATVGAHVAKLLAELCAIDIITLPEGGIGHAGKTFRLDCRFDDLNDVSWYPLLRFELAQRRLADRAFQGRYDVFHRLTPAGWKNSLFQPLEHQTVVVGPILRSIPPPASFVNIFRPPEFNRLATKFSPGRICGSLARRYLERYDSRLLDRADLIVCGTRVTANTLTPDQLRRSITVCYSGVEHQLFTPAAQRRWTREIQLLFVGRLVPYKGLELLLRVVKALKVDTDVILKIVGGSGTSVDIYYRNLCHRLGLDDCVEFVSRVSRPQLIDYYRNADFFCMPSVETYGLAILEAMSCGCVPIVADSNGPGEIVDDQVGVKVPLTDPETFVCEYAAAIRALADSPVRHAELAAACRERVVARHDWSEVLRPFREAYEILLTRSQ